MFEEVETIVCECDNPKFMVLRHKRDVTLLCLKCGQSSFLGHLEKEPKTTPEDSAAHLFGKKNPSIGAIH